MEAFKFLANRASLWRWRLVVLQTRSGEVVYLGRRRNADLVASFLGASESAQFGVRRALSSMRAVSSVIASEVIIPGSLKVPSEVRTLYPTHSEPIKLKEWHRTLASSIGVSRATTDAEIERVYHDLLVPFAIERHGPAASTPSLAAVKNLARYGRLDLLTRGSEVVGAHIGFPSMEGKRRMWVGCRMGYPRHVFEDRHLLSGITTVNYFLQVRQAKEAGFDAYDMGSSPGRPDSGLLVFKARLGGVLAPLREPGHFWVRLPATRAPEVLWNTPLFSLEGRGLVLNVGLPATVSAAEAIKRCGNFSFSGLAAVRVHCQGEASIEAMGALENRFHGTPVELVVA